MYVQLNADGTFLREVPSGNVLWDDTHYCTVDKLTPEEAAYFRIRPLIQTTQPIFNVRSQYCVFDTAILNLDGYWEQKWEVLSYPQNELDDKLVAAKIEKNAYINQSRLNANYTSFVFAGKAIACDALSRSDIESTNSQVLRRNSMPPGWQGLWKAVDNTYVSIPDVTSWNSFYDAMYAQGMANFMKSQQLKSALNTATLDNIDSIVW
jgi:hypothetical protein